MNKSNQDNNDVSSSGYEDSESETSECDDKSHQNSDILKTFLADKGYKGLKVQKKFDLPQIDSDEEEIHLLRIPKTIDPKVLEGTKFWLNKKSKVKTQSGIYHMKPLSYIPQSEFFMHSKGIKKITPKSVLQMAKIVESVDRQTDEIEEKSGIQPTPSDLNTRHSIFGENSVEHIELQEEIQRKIQKALEKFDKKEETPKKKKKQTVISEEYDDKSLLISRILEAKFNDKKFNKIENQDSNDKSKKKRNSSNSNKMNIENILKVESNVVQDCPSPIAKKKRKSKDCGNISIEVEKETILENETSSEKPKKKRNRSNSNTMNIENVVHVDSNGIQDCPAPIEKKKRQSKECGNISNEIKKEMLLENQNSSEKPKKKRDRSNSNTVNLENVLHADPNAVQDSTALSEKKKKRKSKECENTSTEIKKEMISESETVQFSPDEKKKKKRNRDSDAVYIATENCPASLEKKKKRKSKECENISIEIKTEMLSESEIVEFSPGEKKKKKKIRNSDPVYNGGHDCPPPLEKKKKNKKCENISAEIKKEPSSESEILESDVKEKKKRKRNRTSDPEIIKQEFDACLVPPAKKRKPSILSSTLVRDGIPDFQFDASVIQMKSELEG